MKNLKKITLEDLELERIVVFNRDKALCSTGHDCDYKGEYVRCFLDTCVYCPHYETPKVRGRR